jgi:hypothetical protein
MKPSFILHTDSLSVLSKLTTEQKGILLDAIYQYHLGQTVELDPLMDIVFTPFKNQFDRDFVKYLKVVERNRLNGQKGGRPKDVDIEDIVDNPDKPTGTQQNPSGLSETQDNPNNLDSDNDSVNDNDSDSESKKEKEQIDFDGLLKLINITFDKQYKKIPDPVRKSFVTRFTKDKYTKDQFRLVLTNCLKDPFAKQQKYNFCTPEYLSRVRTFEKYLNFDTNIIDIKKPEEQRSLRSELK